jgi:hypothetical protein
MSATRADKLAEEIGTYATGGFHYNHEAVLPYAALLVEAEEALAAYGPYEPPCERRVIPCGECPRCLMRGVLSRLRALMPEEEK